MSLFVAYRACGLCRKYHRLAEELDGNPESAVLRSLYLSLRDSSNLATLKALESAGNTNSSLPIEDALCACIECDYSCARVAEGLQNYINKKLSTR